MSPVRAKEQLPLETGLLAGEVPESVAVRMNGLTLAADLLHGQKTGIFLDQRENYLAAARYARGGHALDCFTSTGGFALHLAAHCESVEAVDSSAPALATARANAAANAIGNIEFTRGRRLRAALRLLLRAPPVLAGGARPARLRQVARKPGGGRARATRRSTCAPCACSAPAAFWSPAPAPTT